MSSCRRSSAGATEDLLLPSQKCDMSRSTRSTRIKIILRRREVVLHAACIINSISKILHLSWAIRFATVLSFVLVAISWMPSSTRAYPSLSSKTSLLTLTITASDLRRINARSTSKGLLMLNSSFKSVSFTFVIVSKLLIHRVKSLGWAVKFSFPNVCMIDLLPIRLLLWTILIDRWVVANCMMIRSWLLFRRLLSLLRLIHVFIWKYRFRKVG